MAVGLGSTVEQVIGAINDGGGVVISIASTREWSSGSGNTRDFHINVRLVSGNLQVGDRLEICKPVYKTVFNRVNGVKTNIRSKYKLKTFIYKTITATDIANIKSGKNILTFHIPHPTWIKNKGFDLSFTTMGSGRKAPRTVRITRPVLKNGVANYCQISNSAYIVVNHGTNIIKGL